MPRNTPRVAVPFTEKQLRDAIKTLLSIQKIVDNFVPKMVEMLTISLEQALPALKAEKRKIARRRRRSSKAPTQAAELAPETPVADQSHDSGLDADGHCWAENPVSLPIMNKDGN